MAFYNFRQTNSGGWFEVDDHKGITVNVIVEADNADEANKIAEDKIGIYFDGCEQEIDCYCCGDRWYEVSDPHDKKDEPMVYGKPAHESCPDGYFDAKAGQAVCIHYKDGRKEWC